MWNWGYIVLQPHWCSLSLIAYTELQQETHLAVICLLIHPPHYLSVRECNSFTDALPFLQISFLPGHFDPWAFSLSLMTFNHQTLSRVNLPTRTLRCFFKTSFWWRVRTGSHLSVLSVQGRISSAPCLEVSARYNGHLRKLVIKTLGLKSRFYNVRSPLNKYIGNLRLTFLDLSTPVARTRTRRHMLQSDFDNFSCPSCEGGSRLWCSKYTKGVNFGFQSVPHELETFPSGTALIWQPTSTRCWFSPEATNYNRRSEFLTRRFSPPYAGASAQLQAIWSFMFLMCTPVAHVISCIKAVSTSRVSCWTWDSQTFSAWSLCFWLSMPRISALK